MRPNCEPHRSFDIPYMLPCDLDWNTHSEIQPDAHSGLPSVALTGTTSCLDLHLVGYRHTTSLNSGQSSRRFSDRASVEGVGFVQKFSTNHKITGIVPYNQTKLAIFSQVDVDPLD